MKILFVTYGGGHVEMCLPVMQALRVQVPSSEVAIMALTTAWGAAKRQGETPLGYRDFTDAPEAARAMRYGEQLADGYDHPAIAREETVAYLGFNFLDWVLAEGEVKAWQRWEREGRRGFRPVLFFRYVLKSLGPDVVVTTNSPRSEQAAIEAAVALGVPCLSMIDLFALPGDSFLNRQTHADVITVLCKATRTNLVNAGVQHKRIVITGNPAFDRFSSARAYAAGRDWRRNRGWQDQHLVLWAGDREADTAAEPWAGTGLGAAVQDTLLQWVDCRPRAGVIVRYHPNEWQKFIPPAYHPRVHWSRPDQEDLLPVLAASDEVLVQGSTTGVQAAVAGKRVLCLRFSPFVRSSGMDLAGLGLAEGVDRLNDLAAKLDESFSAPPAPGGRSDVSALLGVPGGAAAERVARLVVSLARARSGKEGLNHD